MVIYDCEIINAIPPKHGEREAGIRYCEGWHDLEHMGIACIAAYDWQVGRYRMFCQDNLPAFQHLVDQATLVIGFNSWAFDDRLCEVNGVTIPRAKSYDVLVELWRAAGLPESFVYPTSVGFGLDAVCQANEIGGKSGHGALAPVQWQRGEYGTVLDYCLHDVWLLSFVVNRILVKGGLQDPRDPHRFLKMPHPYDILQSLEAGQLALPF